VRVCGVWYAMAWSGIIPLRCPLSNPKSGGSWAVDVFMQVYSRHVFCLCPYIASEATVLRPVLDYMLIIRVGRCSSPFFAFAPARSLSSLSNGQPAETSWTGNLHPLDVPKNFILLLPHSHRTDTIHCPILFPLPHCTLIHTL